MDSVGLPFYRYSHSHPRTIVSRRDERERDTGSSRGASTSAATFEAKGAPAKGEERSDCGPGVPSSFSAAAFEDALHRANSLLNMRIRGLQLRRNLRHDHRPPRDLQQHVSLRVHRSRPGIPGYDRRMHYRTGFACPGQPKCTLAKACGAALWIRPGEASGSRETGSGTQTPWRHVRVHPHSCWAHLVCVDSTARYQLSVANIRVRLDHLGLFCGVCVLHQLRDRRVRSQIWSLRERRQRDDAIYNGIDHTLVHTTDVRQPWDRLGSHNLVLLRTGHDPDSILLLQLGTTHTHTLQVHDGVMN